MVGCVSQTERPLKIRPSLNFLRLCESPQACSFFSESQAWWNFHRLRLHHTQQPGLSSDRDLDHRSHSSACPSPLCQASLSCGPPEDPMETRGRPGRRCAVCSHPGCAGSGPRRSEGGQRGRTSASAPSSVPQVRVWDRVHPESGCHFLKAAMGTHLPEESVLGQTSNPCDLNYPGGARTLRGKGGEAGDNSRSPLYRLQQFCSGSKFAHSHQKNKNACHRDRLPQRTTH